jgi:hypothetical protein
MDEINLGLLESTFEISNEPSGSHQNNSRSSLFQSQWEAINKFSLLSLVRKKTGSNFERARHCQNVHMRASICIIIIRESTHKRKNSFSSSYRGGGQKKYNPVSRCRRRTIP